MYYTTQGYTHFAAAGLGLLLGAVQVARPKGDVLHRRIGYFYVASLVLADATALAVYQFSGRFNVFHVGALVNLACVAASMLPFYFGARSTQAKMRHAIFICWSYLGLWAAGVTELLVRAVPWSSLAQVVGVTVGTTLTVTYIGCLMMRRLRKMLLERVGSAT